MKKALPVTLILIGAALLITAVVFWIDSKTSVEPDSFGKALRDWLTLIAGLGASIKGWLDLLKNDKLTQPTTQIVIQGGNTKIEVGNLVQQESQIEPSGDKHIANNTNIIEGIKPILRQYITGALREQELKEVITDYFPSVELNISSKSSFRELVSELIDTAIFQGKVDYLIEVVREYNTYQYNNHKKKLEQIIRALKVDEN